MAVNKNIKAFYTKFFEVPELIAANTIEKIKQTIVLLKRVRGTAPLTKEQRRQVREYWKPYARISTGWARFNTYKTGVFDPRYIPYTLYYTKIDQHFNNRKLGYGFNDKNYYSRIFSDVKQPDTVARNIGGLLFFEDYTLTNIESVIEAAKQYDEIIFKPSQESGSGRGILFIKPKEDLEVLKNVLLDKKESNYILQAVVKQHDALKKVHESSLNTLRIITIMFEDDVHVLSSVLRMGANSSRLDNASVGGLYIKINSDGTLDKYARADGTNEKYASHPQGLVFEGYKIPNFDKVIEAVKKSAQKTGNFRLVSWDMAIDENGDVLLIEANMRKGGISLHQYCNGPLFGDLTDRVLDEIFLK